METTQINYPHQLKQFSQWVLWRYEIREGKKTKVPYRTDGRMASTTDANTWNSFNSVLAANSTGNYDGIGFVVTASDDFCGVDLDHCRNSGTGEIEQWAKDIVTKLNSYTEITPSMQGVRVWLKGKIPPGGNRQGNIEIYEQGRYFTITGKHLDGTPTTIENRQQALSELHANIFSSMQKENKGNGHHSNIELADTELIEKAMAAANGEMFSRLWQGDTSSYDSDDSRADLALCSMLAFWTGNNEIRIDILFRQSGLYREKWDRKDYRERTIKAAISGNHETYDHSYQSNRNSGYKSVTADSYIVIDKNRNPTLDIAKLTVDIMTKTNFAFMRDNDTGFYYDGGVYKENAERFIAAECQRLVGITPVLTEHKITEIIGHIRRSNYHDRTDFNHDPNIINVKNGLLNVITGFLAQHTPEYLSNVQIPVKYVPGVDCPAIKQFLIDIHNPEDIPTMQELFGYLLTRDYRIQKSFLGVGGGENGKSTEQRLIESFIGKDNCSHKSWQQLENNRFASSALEGKAVNMFADLPSNGVDTTTTFKMLTGGDGIDAERKFKDSYSFLNFAKLIFSTNKPPKVENEDSYAFWRRWIILEYPRQFTDKDKKPNILQELTAPSELSGLLNYALEGLKRLLVNNKFTYSRSVEDVTEYYMKAADPVYAFGAGNKCELDSNATVPKDALYDAFKAYCEQNKIPILKPNAFARALQNQIAFHVKSTRLTDSEGGRVQCWQGIKLSSVKDVKDVNDNSHISLIADGRTEEVTKVEKNIDNPDNPDENPVFTCVCCGSHEFWYRGNNMEMVCWTCHPNPPEDNDEPNS